MKKWIGCLALLIFVAGCGVEASQSIPTTLRPAETFTWTDQPIEFSPPPEGWRQERANQGGRLGVYYVKTGSVGEMIQVAEYTKVGQRDRCQEMNLLHVALDNPAGLDPDKPDYTFLRKAFSKARLSDSPLDTREERAIRVVNEQLGSAYHAFYEQRNVPAAQRFVKAARRKAANIDYQLDDFVDEVIFKAPPHPDVNDIQVGTPVRGRLAGNQVMGLDHSHVRNGRLYRGREIYIMANNRLFVASFLGLEENVPLFDSVVETIRFPKGQCSH